jgi:hypothetical protein
MLTLTTSKIVEIFVDCDDFMIEFSKSLQARGSLIGNTAQPESDISASEIMTICILYHHSRMDCFKSFYKLIVLQRLKSFFPDSPSYPHFVKLKKHYLFELFAFLLSQRLARPSGEANFIDSKKLQACHLKREKQHKVMEGLAAKGKTSTGWFFGLKLHLIINEYGEPVRFLVTSGNKADNNEGVLKRLFGGLVGCFYGDKGYLTKLKAWLKSQGATLITKIKKNMKKPMLSHKQKHYLKRRALIETVFGLLSFQCDIDHTRHRSQHGFFINLFSGLIAYTYLESLPMLKRFSAREIQEGSFVLIKD